MPRTRNFETDEALKAAMLLFWKRGYEATSIQALEKAMGLKRTSIYNSFGNKRKLFRAVLEYYFEQVLVRFRMILQTAGTCRQMVRDMLNEVITLNFDHGYPGGCLVVLSLMEAQQHDQNTRRLLDNTVREMADGITQRLEAAVEAGELPARTDCRRVADQLVAMIMGMHVMAKAGADRKNLQRLADDSAAILLPD